MLIMLPYSVYCCALLLPKSVPARLAETCIQQEFNEQYMHCNLFPDQVKLTSSCCLGNLIIASIHYIFVMWLYATDKLPGCLQIKSTRET